MGKESFVLYKAQYQPIKGLSNEDKGILLDAIFEYQTTKNVPEMSPIVSMAFGFFKNQFELDEIKYLEKCRKNAENGRRGGKRTQANATKRKRIQANQADNDNDNDNDNEKEIPKEVVEIINYLNEKMNASYKTTTKETQRLINGRLSEGHEVKDFLSVIDKKINQWKGTEREIYIRPSTLFSPSKFEGYVNESDVSKVIPLSAIPQNNYQAKKEQQALEDQKKLDEYWSTM